MKSDEVKKLDETHVRMLFPEEHLFLAVNASVAVMGGLAREIDRIEKTILAQAKLKEEFHGLLTLPGVGNILALTIMLEVGDINRFAQVGNYSSYCRCVRSISSSNGKIKGQGNRKNGNKYLSWVYGEASHIAKRYYRRKAAKANEAVAIKAISNKLARASYYIMRDKVPYDEAKLFR